MSKHASTNYGLAMAGKQRNVRIANQGAEKSLGARVAQSLGEPG